MASELLIEDVRWCLRRLPCEVLATLKERRLFLAGGFIRACIAQEPVSDIDLFAPSKDAAEAAARALAGKDHHFLATDNAFTVYGFGKLPVQFIHRWTFERAEDILPSFDFTVARACVWHEVAGWKSLCDERFYCDLAAKRIVYCCPLRNEDAGGSMLRVLKFYQKGYRIPLDSLGRVVARLVAGIRFDHTGNSEEAIAMVVTGLLHEVDPLIDPTHASHLPATRGEQALEGAADALPAK